MNTLFRRFMLTCARNARTDKEEITGAGNAKGIIATSIIREEMENRIDYDYTLSEANSRIAGSQYAYDLLIVRRGASPAMGNVYRPEDVAAVVECKASGLLNPDEESEEIATAANAACALNPNIRFGYISLSERVSAQDDGESRYAANPWNQTKSFLKRRVKAAGAVIYAVTLKSGKDMYDEGSDAEFTEFMQALV